MAKTKTMVIVFGFSFPCLPVSKEKVALISGEIGFSYWFRFSPTRRGWGILACFQLNASCDVTMSDVFCCLLKGAFSST